MDFPPVGVHCTTEGVVCGKGSFLHSLDVNVVISGHCECVGDKVILHSWIHLHNVASLATHVQVVDGGSLQLLWPLTDLEGV